MLRDACWEGGTCISSISLLLATLSTRCSRFKQWLLNQENGWETKMKKSTGQTAGPYSRSAAGQERVEEANGVEIRRQSGCTSPPHPGCDVRSLTSLC